MGVFWNAWVCVLEGCYGKTCLNCLTFIKIGISGAVLGIENQLCRSAWFPLFHSIAYFSRSEHIALPATHNILAVKRERLNAPLPKQAKQVRGETLSCTEWMGEKHRAECEVILEDRNNWACGRRWGMDGGWGCLHISLSIRWMRKRIDRHGQSSAASWIGHKSGGES